MPSLSSGGYGLNRPHYAKSGCPGVLSSWVNDFSMHTPAAFNITHSSSTLTIEISDNAS